jgi:uncharacterized protein
VDRYRHLLYEAWTVSKVEMAVLAELLLRGPQTEGDLRGRASRMDDIPDLEALRTVLDSLVKRGFVVYLTPPGRGAVLTHGFHLPAEIESAKSRAAISGFAEPPPARAAVAPSELDSIKAELAALRVEVEAIKRRLG